MMAPEVGNFVSETVVVGSNGLLSGSASQPGSEVVEA